MMKKNINIDKHWKKIKNFFSKAFCCIKKKRYDEDEDENIRVFKDHALDLELFQTPEEESEFLDPDICIFEEDDVLDIGYSQTPIEFLGTELYSIVNGDDKKICGLEDHALDLGISQTKFLDTDEICRLEDHVLDIGFSQTPAEFLGSELYSIINGDQDEEEEQT